MGVIEQGADRRLVRVITGYCREQCQPGEEPATCTAGKVFMDLEPCVLWPFRTGRNPYISAEQREKLRRHAQEQYQLAGGGARFRPRTIETPRALTFGSPVQAGLKKQAEKRRGVITESLLVNAVEQVG
ncbi:hypothetical protein [Solidesulfovibrio carbinolicus]|uniref:Uncharacterized protein n=1 Tax=Solidesulfovibrio carbinolicus TaxID=296842 RepID=A0A4P6HU02_9BACT|nr:hypothetical protein [Solidesulfovibrio carbinolicus]QAZ69670.1 hypothetical protein C3Y92_20555 [Solidesulfovibrio carbinolicus]